MPRALPSLLVVLLAGCDGNWSDDDVVFASALPWRADLLVRLPAGEGPSASWTATRAAAAGLDGLLGRLLGVMDEARATAPASRSAAGRTWGPFSAGASASTSVELRVTREQPDRFTWALEAQPQGGPAVEVMRGETSAAPSLRGGRSTLRAPLGGVRELLALGAPLDAVEQLDLAASADAGLTVQLALRPGVASSLSRLGYQLTASGPARALRFAATHADAGADITARWLPSGEGQASGVLLDGPAQGATFTECWSAAFETTWLDEAWPGGVQRGDASTCAAVE